MIQWEHITEIGYASQLKELDMLDKYGREGWQLCAAYPAAADNVIKYYFKRPISQPSTAEKIFNEVKNEVGGGNLCA